MTTRARILLLWTWGWACSCGPAPSAVEPGEVSVPEARDAPAPKQTSAEGRIAEESHRDPLNGWYELGRGDGHGHGFGIRSPLAIWTDSPVGYLAYCDRRDPAGVTFAVAASSPARGAAEPVYVISRGAEGRWLYGLRTRSDETVDVDPALCAACHQRRDPKPFFRPPFVDCSLDAVVTR